MKSVINLVRTSQGYSVFEGNQEINKPTSKIKEKSYSASKKLAQHNFTIYPYISNKDMDNQRYIILPARTQWFNFNTVHQIQKKSLPQWFKIKKGIMASMSNIKFEKHEDLYKKYRNHIIQLGKEQYITPSHSRKGLAGDAFAIIRIHKFLEKWGLINYIHTKKNQKEQNQNNVDKQTPIPLSKRKDCFDKDKLIVSRTYGKDDIELLKKITRKFRPICHFCEGISGSEWFQYKTSTNYKTFEKILNKKGKSIKQNTQALNYSLILCASCLHQQNFPIILNSQDFVKRTVYENFEEQTSNYENDKKKNNEQNKIAEAIQKNKFKIAKTAEQLKMTPEYVFRSLMIMPCQKLEKISRIQPQTDIEKLDNQQKGNQKNSSLQVSVLEKGRNNSFEEKIVKDLKILQSEGRDYYEKFLQSWLLKINLKMQKLYDWQNVVLTKFKSLERLQINTLASKVQQLSEGL